MIAFLIVVLLICVVFAGYMMHEMNSRIVDLESKIGAQGYWIQQHDRGHQK